MSTSSESFSHLPVHTLLDELSHTLAQGHAVLSSPTGSGKTTCVPLILRQAPWLCGQKIIMLEPRRIAARAAATRMSALIGQPVGTTVGYRTRFESRISKNTSIEVVTEGILIRQLQNDPELKNIGLVIFDEFHERTIQADLGLALCLDLCQLREELRLLVMSATLATESISQLLGNAVILKACGRSYPVTIHHLPAPGKHSSLTHQLVRGVHHAWENEIGDILAFLPGAGEIKRCSSLLAKQLPEAMILPLYGGLSHSQQDRVFKKATGRRRIILASPIAETSITIENISCVVDSGYFKRPVYDSRNGLSRLTTLQISKASAAQRAGRAGRLGPGSCYRLWHLDIEHNMLEHTPAEILHADLTPLILELALWGVTDPNQLAWLDVPRPSAWQNGLTLLRRLTLIDKQSRITPLGARVAALPLHPRLGYMLVAGAKSNLGWTACLLAATLSERDLLSALAASAEISARVKIIAEFNADKDSIPRDIDKQLCRSLLSQANQWHRLLANSKKEGVEYTELGNLLSYAFPDRIAQLRPGSRHNYMLASGKGATLAANDLLTGSKMLVAPQIDARQGDGKIFMATSVSISQLQQNHPHLLEKSDNIHWDAGKGRIHTSRDTMIGKIVIESKPLAETDQCQLNEIFLQGVKQGGLKSLPWTKEARELQARISSLHAWQPEHWPDLSDENLLHDLRWLAPYSSQMSRLKQLKQLNLKTIFLALLPWHKQQRLERLAPSHLPVASGSRIRISYHPGKPPVLAVRLQELFGTANTPTVCEGKITVIMHLLSPARRPVQITSDLSSFWQNSYPEIKKELAGRYPKHYWPDNPLLAVATSRTKRGMINNEKLRT